MVEVALPPKYDEAQLFKNLGHEEGFKPSMYRDSRGNWTAFYGHNMSVPQTQKTAYAVYLADVAVAEEGLDAHTAWWRFLDPVRQLVMVDMAFNMGIAGLMTFTEFLAAMNVRDWPTAAKDMMESKWQAQVGNRAVFLQEIVLTGQVPATYP